MDYQQCSKDNTPDPWYEEPHKEELNCSNNEQVAAISVSGT